jgi:hypothetical protein
VIVYYIDKSIRNRIIIITLKRLRENHSGENINFRLIKIIENFDLNKNLKYFITNNANSNNTCVDHVLIIFLFKFNKIGRIYRYLYYFGYILNLAYDLYLYGKDSESFKIKIFVFESLARE